MFHRIRGPLFVSNVSFYSQGRIIIVQETGFLHPVSIGLLNICHKNNFLLAC